MVHWQFLVKQWYFGSMWTSVIPARKADVRSVMSDPSAAPYKTHPLEWRNDSKPFLPGSPRQAASVFPRFHVLSWESGLNVRTLVALSCPVVYDATVYSLWTWFIRSSGLKNEKIIIENCCSSDKQEIQYVCLSCNLDVNEWRPAHAKLNICLQLAWGGQSVL